MTMQDFKEMSKNNNEVNVLGDILKQHDINIYLKDKLEELTQDPVKNLRFYKYSWEEVSSKGIILETWED